jgi:hypothetical protein
MRNVAKVLFRILLLGGFILCCLFWLSVCIYTIRGFVTGGTVGVQQWFMHIDRGHSDSLTYVPHWGLILARIAAIAALTLVLWLANRRVIKGSFRDRNHEDKKRTA